jgi:hypothetical protein
MANERQDWGQEDDESRSSQFLLGFDLLLGFQEEVDCWAVSFARMTNRKVEEEIGFGSLLLHSPVGPIKRRYCTMEKFERFQMKLSSPRRALGTK